MNETTPDTINQQEKKPQSDVIENEQSPESILTTLNENIQSNELRINKLSDSIKPTIDRVTELRNELGITNPDDTIPSVINTEEKIKKLEQEKQDLEAEKDSLDKTSEKDENSVEENKVQQFGGAAIYHMSNEGEIPKLEIALIQSGDTWTLPMAEIPEGQDMESGVKDVITHQAGIDASTETLLDQQKKVGADNEGNKVDIEIDYYLAKASKKDSLSAGKGLQVEWIDATQLGSINIDSNIRHIVFKAVDSLTK